MVAGSSELVSLFKNMTLRKRLTILILLSVMTIMSIVGLIRINASAETIYNDREDKVAMTADLAVGSLTEPLWTYNDEALKAIGDALFRDQEIGLVTITGTNGTLLYEKRIVQSPAYELDKLIIVKREVVKENLTIGQITLGFTNYYNELKLRSETLNTVGGIVLTCVVLSLVVTFVSRMVTRPLYELSEGTEEIAGGNFDKRLHIAAKDEIGRLANKFNLMAQNIQAMMDERQEQYDQLNASHEELTAAEEELRSLYAEVVNTNQRLEHSQQTVEEIFNAVGDGLVVHDIETGEILAVNHRMTELFGCTVEQFKQEGMGLIFTPSYKDDVLAVIRRTVSEKTQLFEHETVTCQGGCMILEINLSRAVIDGKICCLAVLRDITARKEMEKRMEFFRINDPLTGVFNRGYFENEIQRIKTGPCQGIGLLICDVDGLKLINDTLGHRQGDELLKKVAELLQSGIQKPNYVCRIGGDEFAVILFEPTTLQLEELDRYYQSKVSDYNQGNPYLPLSLSFGWAIDMQNINIDTVFTTADNNMYRQKLHQSQSIRSSIVQAMMKALEVRDHITEGHADRLGDLMEMMGEKLQVSPVIMADLRLFAKFHDIGKVGIPDSILNKPGRLTEEEMTIMRQHCDIGYRIAKSSPDLIPIAEWILKHQEHWNGNGYPLGLIGEDIPLPCRILAIVDAYDAMTNDRPYRKGMSHQDAIAEIRRCAGTQFDPELTDAFVDVLEEKIIQ
ncbi:MAG: diguanylate cyclase with sensor [Firmicutes bacterium]|nr:diguanylate cyclase with sensor [Bacillota bacterium]